MHPLAYTLLHIDIHKLTTKPGRVVCLLHNPLCVQQHETAFLREFSEEFAFIWNTFISNTNLKGVLFGRNNILGVLTVCSHAQVDRRVRQLKLVSHKCPCSWHLLSSSVYFGIYLSLILCWPGGKQHLLGFSLDIYLSVHGNSVRTKFEDVFFPLVCVSLSPNTWSRSSRHLINFGHVHLIAHLDCTWANPFIPFPCQSAWLHKPTDNVGAFWEVPEDLTQMGQRVRTWP